MEGRGGGKRGCGLGDWAGGDCWGGKWGPGGASRHRAGKKGRSARFTASAAGSFSSSSRISRLRPARNVSHFTAGSLSRLRVSATVRRTVSEVARSESSAPFAFGGRHSDGRLLM